MQPKIKPALAEPAAAKPAPAKPAVAKPVIAKRALASEIAQAIRLRMYRPGEWLRQIDLEEKFQATRFDVRGALEELAIRKTIEHVPNRGYRVAEIDLATYRAIRDTRIIIEAGAMAGVVAHIGEAEIARLAELAMAFSEAAATGTRNDQSEINSAFHHLIYASCGNPVLDETIWALRDRSRGSSVTVWASHEALLASARDHHAMVEALRRRDAAELAALITRHIDKDMG
ncbi:GntR family transcriptional regulator [Bosea sp. 124]|uniref:GntR family transcriptional regulator n=1 Tax=Bosea sp. 124 TaxID=2135642 RepID=UPI000D37DED6|nr:GntR family transcriptional regulator [Bosea sp. 124]PTM40082.1 DNA-binding GntR family transcriptional regulator [Bosea sp. 124]